MLKAKYKVGNLVKIESDDTPTFGVINAVVTTEKGFWYRVESSEAEYAEENILTAYREIKARTTRAKTAKRSSTKNKKQTEETASAVQ